MRDCHHGGRRQFCRHLNNRSFWRGRGCLRAGGGADVFALIGDDRDRCVDRNVLGAVGDQDFGEHTFVNGLHFHGGLVGLDLGENVAGLDFVAFFLEPFGKLALLHGRRKGGHQNVGGHGVLELARAEMIGRRRLSA